MSSAASLTVGGAGAAASFATASITPTSSILQFAFVFSTVASGTANQPTITGDGLTWTAVKTATSGTRRITLFVATGSASAGVLTIDFAAQTQTGCCWSIGEITGADVSVSASAAVIQTVSGGTFGADPSITLAAFASVNNATLGGTANTGSSTPTAGGSFTEVNAGLDGVGDEIESEFASTNQTTVNWTMVAANWSGIAAEIKAAGAAAPTAFAVTAGARPFPYSPGSQIRRR